MPLTAHAIDDIALKKRIAIIRDPEIEALLRSDPFVEDRLAHTEVTLPWEMRVRI